jgi:oxygen-independent coproporphyrinogen-3 oxidase
MNSETTQTNATRKLNRKTIPYGIYIHVPFCRQACSYCDFYFVTRQQLIPAYTEALLSELRFAGPKFIHQLSEYVVRESKPETGHETPASSPSEQVAVENESARVETPTPTTQPQPQLVSVYFGGGTPSRLPASAIARIMETIDQVHSLSHIQEVTLEANPDDVTSKDYLLTLKSAGITRLSMGVQSFNPDLLKFMHRAHSAYEARRSLELIRDSGFDSFTVDLIYGNPGQTLEMLDEDITELLRFDPPHVSAYALTIEPNTRLGKYAKLGRLHEPDDSMVSSHMSRVSEQLADHGLYRYEVSNFARPGHEAVHNSNYWEHVPYLGAGPGAHSLLTFSEGASILNAKRWENEPDLKQYIDSGGQIPRFNEETLDANSLAEERLMMGLRTRKGIAVDELVHRYGYRFNPEQLQFIEKQCLEGRMEILANKDVVNTEYDASASSNIQIHPRVKPEDNHREIAKQQRSSKKQSDKPLIDSNSRLRLSAEGLALADRITLELISR